MGKLKSSVIMATYNGKAFIEQQLDSLRQQSISPDEVLIADDCSSDGTYEYIKKYVCEHNLNWNVTINKANMGWEKNFYQLMKRCDGDVIFYSDQDDIWDKNKISHMMTIMNENTNILCLASKFDAIDGNGSDIDVRKIYAFQNMVSKDTRSIRKISFSPFFMKDFFPGCVLCFRKNIVLYMDKIGMSNNLPDRQICRIANLYDGLYMLDSSLIKHRFHENNSGGNINQLNGKSTIGKRLSELNKDVQWISAVLDAKIELSNEKNIVLCQEYEALLKRIKYLKNDKYVNIIDVIKRTGIRKEIIADFCYKHSLNNLAGRLYYMFKTVKCGAKI